MWAEPLHDNDGRPEETKDVIMLLKRKKINIVEFQWMSDRCVSILPLFPFTCKNKANEP